MAKLQPFACQGPTTYHQVRYSAHTFLFSFFPLPLASVPITYDARLTILPLVLSVNTIPCGGVLVSFAHERMLFRPSWYYADQSPDFRYWEAKRVQNDNEAKQRKVNKWYNFSGILRLSPFLIWAGCILALLVRILYHGAAIMSQRLSNLSPFTLKPTGNIVGQNAAQLCSAFGCGTYCFLGSCHGITFTLSAYLWFPNRKLFCICDCWFWMYTA